MKYNISIITPTRDRAAAFALCVRWMRRQKYDGLVQWIVVDDGDAPAVLQPIGSWTIDYARRSPSSDVCTLQDNLLEALQRVDAPKILIMEDDEWYSPEYVAQMSSALDWADLVGEKNARYYNVGSRRWHQAEGGTGASLCRTGLCSPLLGALADCAKASKASGDVAVDLRLWHDQARAGVALPCRGLSVAIKGMPGRGGLGKNHRWDAFSNRDPNLQVLSRWVGAPDAQLYAPFLDPQGAR